MSDNAADTILDVWLGDRIDEDHTKPRNETELENEREVGKSQYPVMMRIFQHETEMDVVKYNVKKKRIFEKRICHRCVFPAGTVIPQDTDLYAKLRM